MRLTLRTSLTVLALAGTAGPLAAQVQQAASATAPMAERRVRVDTLHGEVRRDEYFWLRNKEDPAVRAYLEAENAYAASVMAPLRPLQEQLYNEMLGRIRQTDLSVPYPLRGYQYFTRTEEGKQYPIYVRQRLATGAAPEVLLDQNELARGQTFMGLGGMQVSDDNNLLAFSTDSTGFREYVLRFKDLRTGAELADRIPRTAGFTWAADNRTIFYTTQDHAKRSYRLWRHVLGQPVAQDQLVYEERDERFRVGIGRTRSREYLVMTVGSLTASEVRVLRAAEPMGEFRLLSPRVANREYYVDHRGDRFYIRVNDRGPNFRLVTAPVANPVESSWRELLPHRADVMLTGVSLFQDYLVLSERRGGLPTIAITDLRTNASHTLQFPEPVYSAFLSTNAEWSTQTLRYSYQSFVTPSSIYDYRMDTRQATLLKRTDVLGGFDGSRYASERVWVTARDGVRVPVSLVYKRGVPRDGSAPMLLYAYGSYGSSSDIGFSSARLSLLDRGVVYAVAHIRGGGEMGKEWHEGGRMMRKMNTFTDFIDVADHMVRERWTSPQRLVIEGGSAGGLLMGAVTNMRPDLFRAVMAHVPFVDVINTMLDETLPLTVGEFEEWGNPKKADEYAYMRQYDPYMIIAAKNYPAILVTTSFNDSQVMYHEPAKYTARMRAMKTDRNPLLLVTNMGAGHGGASGRYDRLREVARDYSFALWQMGLAQGATP